MKNILFALVVMTFGSVLSAQTEVFLTFDHKLGNEPFEMNVASKNNIGHDFSVSRLQYYISQITLTHDGGMQTVLNDNYMLVDPSKGSSARLGSFPITTLEGVSYGVGVDTNRNHDDPSSFSVLHPLAPVNPSMHWGWASGYRFMALEGKCGPNLDQTIDIHGLGDVNYFKVQHPLTIPASNNEIKINIIVDCNRLLEDMLLIGGVLIHSDIRQARQLLENARDYAFSVASGNSGRSEFDADIQIDVFPNPTVNQQVFLRINSDITDEYDVVVYNILGQKVSSSQRLKHNNIIDFPSKGIYILQLIRDGRVINSKKVISK